jgi:hypothetical protein
VRNRDGSFQLSAVRPVTFNELFAWTVYPNPSAGLFYLSYRAAEGVPVQFRLYDAQGSLLRQWSRMATGFVEKLQVDLSGKVMQRACTCFAPKQVAASNPSACSGNNADSARS